MSNLKFQNTFLLFFTLSAFSLNAQIIYVKTNGIGNGSSWAQAQGNLRQAIANAANGSQIWVAAGTYTPTKCTTCTQSDRNVSFNIPEGVAVLGGFVGTETSLHQRNWKTNPTVLSGNIDSDTTAKNNSYNVIYTRNVTKTTLIDGFYISDGNANDTLGGAERTISGGGWYNDGRLMGNFSHPSVKNCVFQNNRSSGFGSAMMNNAAFGGRCESEFQNCIFQNNISGAEGGAVRNASAFGGVCNTKFTFCQFIDNYSGAAGGGVFNDAVTGVCNPVFTNCRFIRNTAGTYGGGIYNLGKSGNASPTITNCLFWGNKALSAAAVYCLGSENGNSSPRITNSVFYKNQANTCGSIYANANDTTGKSSPIILNCIIWGNIATTAPYIRSIESYPILDYSIIDAPNETAVYRDHVRGHGACGAHVLYNQNPLFADPDNGDFRVIPPSPAINSGIDSAVLNIGLTVDLDSFPRIVDGRVDMGILEYNRAVSFPPRLEQSPPNSTVCEREVVVLKALFSGSPPLYYQWYKNGAALPNETNDSLKFVNGIMLSDSGLYRCIVRNSLNIKDSSAISTLKTKPILPLSISIRPDRIPDCEGDSITLLTTWNNGGTRPRFDWQLNDNSLGVSDSLKIYKAAVNSIWFRYTCRITSSEQCALPKTAVSNELQYQNILPIDTANLTLIKTPTGAVCASDTITFSTDAKLAGTNPVYQWYRNNTLLSGNLSTLKTTVLANNDTVKVVMTSSRKCLIKNPIESNKIVTAVNPRLTASVVLAANKLELCQKETVVFTTTAMALGTTPQYQWRRNELIINNLTSTYTTDSLRAGDSIQVIATSSERCLTAPNAASNKIKPKVNLCNSIFENTENSIRLSPNPSAESRFTMSGLDGFEGDKIVSIFTTNGQLIFSKTIKNGEKEAVLDIKTTLSNGLYWVKIATNERQFYKKWVLL